MSDELNFIGNSEPAVGDHDIADAATTRMQPVLFEFCFGWLHRATDTAGSDTGVVLCTGLGRDCASAHRSFRILADRLSVARYPTLRFDYPGTGDSCDPETPDVWSEWCRSIHAAIDWLRMTAHVERIVLVGLRAGAMLAALTAAERTDVAALVLLEPVLRGKSYVSQLTIEARLRPSDPLMPTDGIALDGLVLNARSLAQINAVDLRAASLPDGCAVAVFSRAPSAIVTACLQRWNDGMRQVLAAGFAGLEGLLRAPHLADEPSGDFTAMLSWLRMAVPARTTKKVVEDLLLPTAARRQGCRSGSVNPLFNQCAIANRGLHQTTVCYGSLLLPGCRETPIRFGSLGSLFGILCEPSGGSLLDVAVVIANTGGDPHHGFARFSVELARRLAAAGFASFRLDFTGLGDSIDPTAGNEAPTHVFEIDRVADFRAAFDALAALGYHRFVVNGLCSGAYHAYVAGIADPRVCALLLINLPWFSLRFERAGPDSFASRSMAGLKLRGARTVLLFAEGDAGIKTMEKHFGPGGVALSRDEAASVSILNGIDHNLTGGGMRALVAGHMIDVLRSLQAKQEYRQFETSSAEA